MSEEFFETIAYHTTEKDRATSILKDKFFKESTKDNEWLGQGIYFWDSLEDAVWWKNHVKNAGKDDTVIIKVKLKCKYSEYKDLSIKKNMEEYEKECMEVMTNNELKLIKTSDDKLRNFYCNYYKSKLGIKLLSYDFRVRNKFNEFGFEKHSIQYCLGENFQSEILEIRGVIENVW